MANDILIKTRDWKSKEYYFENLDNILFQQIFLYPVNLVSIRYDGQEAFKRLPVTFF